MTAAMSRPSLLLFCLRSLWREYGWEFMTRIVFRYPVRVLRGVRAYVRNEGRRGKPGVPSDGELEGLGGPEGPRADSPVLGLGFCLKPLEPACPSGRANHDCQYFTHPASATHQDLPAACGECRIRLLGERALRQGWAVYIMTSAQDILRDLLLPVLEEERFSHAILSLCRYSFDPFRIALSVVGLRAVLVPFESGDCRDYRSWRRADMGFKDDQTCFSGPDLAALMRAFPEEAGSTDPKPIVKRGNMFFPS